MCEKCVEAVRKHFPTVPDERIGELLWSSTAFPLAEPDVIDRQLAEMAGRGITAVDEACAFADEAMDRAMKEYRDERECGEIMRL